MKKTMIVLALMIGIVAFGATSAMAVPTVDGSLGGGEWANINTPNGTPYPYYLEVFDPNEGDNQIDTMDIKHVVLLQELSSVSGDANDTNDGIYLLIETYATPPSLQYPSAATYPGIVAQSAPMITMQGDFLGDGVMFDGFNIFIRHYNSQASTGLVANDVVEVCFGDLQSCDGAGTETWTILQGVPGTVGGVGDFDRGTVLEYFIPSGAFSTPHSQFPYSFIGSITYDNGASGVNSADDVAIGTLIPEPGSMFLFGTALLGLLGVRFKK